MNHFFRPSVLLLQTHRARRALLCGCAFFVACSAKEHDVAFSHSGGSAGENAATGGSAGNPQSGGANHGGAAAGGNAASQGGSENLGGSTAGGSIANASAGASTASGGTETSGGASAHPSGGAPTSGGAGAHASGGSDGGSQASSGGSGGIAGGGAQSSGGTGGASTSVTLKCWQGDTTADFPRACIADGDCFPAQHYVGCCRVSVVGLASSAQTQFSDFEQTTCGGVPPCGCAVDQLTTDDGKMITRATNFGARCVSGVCMSWSP